jgi:flavin reductase (DIM6/NTAB) family NADH-FMN oxidoreductase RutF
MDTPHVSIEPSILYFGTPVVLISTVNDDGTFNLAPMSSAFWLGWRCVLGLDASSKTPQNMLRTGECVLNLPSVHEVGAVNRLAKLTGVDPVPACKVDRGYRYEPKKFEAAGLTPAPKKRGPRGAHEFRAFPVDAPVGFPPIPACSKVFGVWWD